MKNKVLFVVILIALILCFLMSGCYWKNIKKTEYYENGQIKSEFTDTSEGFDPVWSSGDNKQMPFSHVDISGVGL